MKTFNVRYVIESDGNSEVTPQISPSESMLPRIGEFVSSRAKDRAPKFRRVMRMLHDYHGDCHNVVIILADGPFGFLSQYAQ